MTATTAAPYGEDPAVGQVPDSTSVMTLSAGARAPLAHPGPLCDVAIGQSTLVTALHF